MTTTAIRGYQFGQFTLDLARRRLSRPGQDAMPLSGRAFDVLAFLVTHRDRVVSKQELLDAVWPRMVVEENNLTQAISALRRVLVDSRGSPQFIATIAGRGYQFVGDAQPIEADTVEVAGTAGAIMPNAGPGLPRGAATETASPPGMSRRDWLAAAGAATAAVVIGGVWALRSRRGPQLPDTMAVLPFRPLASTARNEAIEYGVTELLINRLSMLPGIVVRPLSSVRRYSSLEQDATAAGHALGVAAVVEGYVHIERDDVQLTARLLDVRTGQSLWAGNFHEKLGNFFDVQDALVTQIVSALPVELPQAARQRLVAYSTADSEAWQLYANGRYQVERRDQSSVLRAKDYFEKAIARDPKFALAITGLSEACALSGTFAFVPPNVAFEEARAAAKQALAIDPNLPVALVALGHVLTQLDHDWEEARRLYHHALALEPRAAWTYSFLALNSVQSSSPSTALEHIGRAQALEPAAFPFMAVGGFVRYFNREFDASRRELSNVVESVPGAALPRQFLARTLLIQGDAAAVIKLLEGRNDPAPGSYSSLGRAYAMVGRVDDARFQVDSVEALGAQGFGVGYDLAQMHLALGDRARALDALERGTEDGSQMIGYINVDAAFDSIHDDPRVRAVAKKVGLG